MLKIIESIIINKNECSNQDHNTLKNVNLQMSSKLVFNKIINSLLTREIEFDNISAEEKKKIILFLLIVSCKI
ncbi:hypothetical protein [Buchnera aphidicola]|uniref:hypothetical protein n=1 Tax=Buchnera aphidicola TaxID=9 RepID=UPI003BEED331